MDVEMELRKKDSNLCAAKNKKKRNKKKKALSGSVSADNEGHSLVQDVVVEKDSCSLESSANVGSSHSGLIEDRLNSNMNSLADKKRRRKQIREWRKIQKAALKAVNMDVGVQEVASETKPDFIGTEASVDVRTKPVSEKDFCAESTGNIDSSSGLIKVQSNSVLNIIENKKKRKRDERMKRKALKAVNKDSDLQEVASETKPDPIGTEALVDVRKKPVSEKDLCVECIGNIGSSSGLIEVLSNSDDVSTKLVSDKDSCVESTGKISSSSGLIDVQSNSNMNISENKKGKKVKKKKCKALKADNTDIDLQEVVSETKTAPFKIEGPADVSIKTVSETAPVEVDVPDDLSKEMDSIATSIEIEAAVDTSTKINPLTNLSCSQKKKLKRNKKKRAQNSLGQHDVDHIHPEDNALTKDMVLEKDTSLLSSANMCSEKQPNGHISFCLEKNEVKELNDGHKESENNSRGNRHMGNGKRYGKKDVKFASAAAELGLTRVKEDLLVSEKQSNSSKIEDTSLFEKHDLPANSVNTYKKKKKVKTYPGKKRIEPSDSGENTSDSIKENRTGLASFGHSEAALVTSFSENKLVIELERKNNASVQVLEDIIMTEASIDCSDGKPVCKDNENGMKMKISKEDEENLELSSREKLKEIKITVQEVSNANGVSDENLSRPTEKASNAEVETKVGEIFPSSSHLGVAKIDVVDDSGKEDNLLQKSYPSPERACIGHCKKKLLVLDVNGLLADIIQFPKSGYTPHKIISKKAVFKRPYCDDFLRFCFERFNIGVWSSRIRRNVVEVVKFLMGDLRSNLLFVWDAAHCTKTGLNTVENKNKPLVLKELKLLWDKLVPNLPWEKGEYDETNTLLLDDSPYKALRNPAHTAIFPYSYEYTDANDSSLGPGGDLRVYLEGLAAAENVQEYIKQNPFGQLAITESNPFWDFYSKIIGTNNPSQPHDTSSTSSVVVSSVVSRMPFENTSETGFGSQVTLLQAASASETCDNNTVTPMDIHCS